MCSPANVRFVKSRPMFAILSLFAFAGCSTGTQYTRFIVTGFRGEHIADWIAEGPIRHAEHGYKIKAVERLSGGAYPVLTRYPNGRTTFVVGPNIIQQPVPKPQWLVELDAEQDSIQAGTGSPSK